MTILPYLVYIVDSDGVSLSYSHPDGINLSVPILALMHVQLICSVDFIHNPFISSIFENEVQQL
jgi:hypothetical protein